MNFLTALKRLRLETDRTMRTRAFIARAIRDEVPPEAYGELVTQLGLLVDAVGGGGSELASLARQDLEELGQRRPTLARAFPAVRLFSSARAQYRKLVPLDVEEAAGLAVLGTSWTRDAEEGISRHSRRPRAFLGALGARGRDSLDRLIELLEAGSTDPQLVYAFAELARGALLGIANDLDSRWPVQLVVMSMGRTME